MDRLERYLQSVKKYLPWQRQDDILAELRANLESQLEDNEAEIGRPLTDAEIETWLKQFGPPMQVAARYAPQQYLIGPNIFPTYWYILRMACFWVLVVYSIANAIQIAVANSTWNAVAHAIFFIPSVLVMTAGWVTLVFAALEYVLTNYPQKWPELTSWIDRLPSKVPDIEMDFASGKKPRSYPMAVAGVVFSVLFLIWLLLVPKHPVLMFGPGAQYMNDSPFLLAPVWYQFYWWIVALNVVQLAWRCIDLLRGAWQHPNRAEQIVSKALGLVPILLVLFVPDHVYVTLKNPSAEMAHYGATATVINQGIHTSTLIVCAIVSVQLLWEIGRTIWEVSRKRAAAM
jgi:hypothetical protein